MRELHMFPDKPLVYLVSPSVVPFPVDLQRHISSKPSCCAGFEKKE